MDAFDAETKAEVERQQTAIREAEARKVGLEKVQEEIKNGEISSYKAIHEAFKGKLDADYLELTKALMRDTYAVLNAQVTQGLIKSDAVLSTLTNMLSDYSTLNANMDPKQQLEAFMGIKINPAAAPVRRVPGGRGVLERASGGYISGTGTGTSDSIPARLSNGEYVIRASSVAKYGVPMMDTINTGNFKMGGIVRNSMMPKYKMGGMVQYYANGGLALNGAGNNYQININGTNISDPNVLADIIIRKIDSENSRRSHSRSM